MADPQAEVEQGLQNTPEPPNERNRAESRMTMENYQKLCGICAKQYEPETTPRYDGCSVCNSDRVKAGGIYLVTDTCCRDCIVTAIATGLSAWGPHGISCLRCSSRMNYDDIKTWASAPVFERYDYLLARDSIQTDSNFVWCPNTQCQSGQILSTSCTDDPVKCLACGTKFCTRHPGRPWHDGLTCKEVDNPARALRRVSRDTSSRWCLPTPFGRLFKRQSRTTEKQSLNEKERLLKGEMNLATTQKTTRKEVVRISKPCPKCGVRIQKNGGCSHMTCNVGSSKHTLQSSLIRLEMWYLFLF